MWLISWGFQKKIGIVSGPEMGNPLIIITFSDGEV